VAFSSSLCVLNWAGQVDELLILSVCPPGLPVCDSLHGDPSMWPGAPILVPGNLDWETVNTSIFIMMCLLTFLLVVPFFGLSLKAIGPRSGFMLILNIMPDGAIAVLSLVTSCLLLFILVIAIVFVCLGLKVRQPAKGKISAKPKFKIDEVRKQIGFINSFVFCNSLMQMNLDLDNLKASLEQAVEVPQTLIQSSFHNYSLCSVFLIFLCRRAYLRFRLYRLTTPDTLLLGYSMLKTRQLVCLARSEGPCFFLLASLGKFVFALFL
jgi:hypothetical protein